MIHSFLLIGQSNMAGRGNISNAPKADSNGGRIKVLRNGRWQRMFRPVNPDRAFAGVCLAESFAKAYSEDHPDVEVGLIPCADGGTSLDQWREGGLLFDNAVNCARLAMRTSSLAGILWHQGEADCAAELYPLYFDKVSAIMTALRRELGAEDIPIIVGSLGDFLKDCPLDSKLANYGEVNRQLVRFAESTHRAAFASAEGLTSNKDLLHFNWESLLEFGLRYYEAFKGVEDKDRIFKEKISMDDAVRTEMELL